MTSPARQGEHGLVERLDRSRVGRDEPLGARERVVEARVAEHEERVVALEVREPEPRLGDDAERSLAPGHELREVDARPVGRRHAGEVVARSCSGAAWGRCARCLRAARGGDLARELVRLADETGLRAARVELGAGHARRAVHDAAAKHDLEVDHVLAGLAVEARPFAARVGRDHPAEGGAVRRREVGREEDPVRLEEPRSGRRAPRRAAR